VLSLLEARQKTKLEVASVDEEIEVEALKKK
jgi:hypothetical protein